MQNTSPNIKFLPNLSKLFERCMDDQLNDYFDKILSKYSYGFRKAGPVK